jgi:hypothetical protein
MNDVMDMDEQNTVFGFLGNVFLLFDMGHFIHSKLYGRDEDGMIDVM